MLTRVLQPNFLQWTEANIVSYWYFRGCDTRKHLKSVWLEALIVLRVCIQTNTVFLYTSSSDLQALRQLCLLIAAKTMTEASKRCLFPSAQSLFSLSMEYGVPLYRTQPKLSLIDCIDNSCVVQLIVQAYEHTAYEDINDDNNDSDSQISIFQSNMFQDIKLKSKFWGSDTSLNSDVTSTSSFTSSQTSDSSFETF